jgi:hypothetical protein
MAKKLKFLRQYGEFRKHKEYVVAENVAVHFLMNGVAELIEDHKPCKEGDCEDCEDCKGKKKKKASKVVIENAIEEPKKAKKKTPKKKKAPTKK